jgi:hypothetical protein
MEELLPKIATSLGIVAEKFAKVFTDPEIVELWQAQKVLKSKNKLTIEFKLLLRKTTP